MRMQPVQMNFLIFAFFSASPTFLLRHLSPGFPSTFVRVHSLRALIIVNFLDINSPPLFILIPPRVLIEDNNHMLFNRHLVVSGFIFHFPQLETIKASSMIGRHELREGDEAVLIAVLLLQHLVHDLHLGEEVLTLDHLVPHLTNIEPIILSVQWTKTTTI